MNRNILIIGAAVVSIFVLFMIWSNRPDKDVTEVSTSSPSAMAVYNQAKQALTDGNKLDAKAAFNQLLMEHPDFDKIEEAQQELFALNMEIIYSNLQTESSTIHEVVSGDTLGKLAKKYGTTIELIQKSNNLKGNIIRIGQRLRIWTGQFNIHVDKSQNILMLRMDDEVIKVYDVSTGENNITPVGEFKVTTKLVDPVWFKSGAIIAPDSPANVLGTRWLGFDIPGYGIHGTIEPETIGQQATAGCVRMRNEEVNELYDLIPMGTSVKVVD